MKILIIEDELPTAKEMARTLQSIDTAIEIVSVLSSVEDIDKNFDRFHEIDLIFSDIQLSDGLSIEALIKHRNSAPIIFCTAYDHYALEAFQTNGIDYILKPFTAQTMSNALNKFKRLTHKNVNLSNLTKSFQKMRSKHKSHLIIHRGDKIIPISIEDIAFFHIESTNVYAYNFDGKRNVINETLDNLESSVGEMFFRVNRQALINRKAITSASKYFGRKILLHLNVTISHPIIVSRLKTNQFMEWLESI